MVRFQWSAPTVPHHVHRYAEDVRPLGIVHDGLGLEYMSATTYVDDLPSDFVALALGGTYTTKRLPDDKIIKLGQALHAPVVHLGGAQEEETAPGSRQQCLGSSIFVAN